MCADVVHHSQTAFKIGKPVFRFAVTLMASVNGYRKGICMQRTYGAGRSLGRDRSTVTTWHLSSLLFIILLLSRGISLSLYREWTPIQLISNSRTKNRTKAYADVVDHQRTVCSRGGETFDTSVTFFRKDFKLLKNTLKIFFETSVLFETLVISTDVMRLNCTFHIRKGDKVSIK